MREAVRIGDVVEVTGTIGQDAHGDYALLVRELLLRKIVLPMDVIFT